MLLLRDISETKLQNVKIYQKECIVQIFISDSIAYKTKSKKHYMDKETKLSWNFIHQITLYLNIKNKMF